MSIYLANSLLSNMAAGAFNEGVQFGTWNGTATSGELLNQYGQVPNAARGVSIYRNDWQGNQLLYPTPRTNYALDTNNLLAASWTTTGLASLVASGTAPDGNTAWLATQDTTTNNHRVVNNFLVGVGIGSFQTLSFWVKNGTASSYVALMQYLGNAGYLFVTFSTPTGSPQWVGNGLPSFGTMNAALIPYPNGWYRLVMTVRMVVADTLIFAGPCVDNPYDTGTGLTAYFSDPQLELNSQSTAYIANAGTAPLTITDYSLTGTTVNLAQAPASTAVTTATFYGS